MRRLRSLLFVPADSPRKIEKSRELRPDAVILDLEDAVAPAAKGRAREALSRALEGFRHPSAAVFVRVNGPRTEGFELDLEAAAAPAVEGVVLPKCEAPDDVARAARVLERAPAIRLLPSVESAAGVLAAADLARAGDRVLALVFGAEDFCADLGIRRTASGDELAHARSAVVLAARAAGRAAVDAAFMDLEDEAGLLRDARRAKAMGFAGKLLVHPRQIEPVHRAFAPDETDVAWARKVLEAFEAAGAGLAVVDGRLVDAPVVLQARRILEEGPDR